MKRQKDDSEEAESAMTDMSIPRLVVLDLAGTTIVDGGEVPESFSVALATYGVEVSDDQLNNVRGSSKRQAVFDLIPDSQDKSERAAEIYSYFREVLTTRYVTDGVESIAGAESVFTSLRDRGVKVVLNTGFDREVTKVLLDALKWGDWYVDGVICGDDVEHGRPAPDLILAAMRKVSVTDGAYVANLGDTILDLKAGNNAGVKWNIGVLSGAHTSAKLEQVPHTHLIESVAQLPELLFG